MEKEIILWAISEADDDFIEKILTAAMERKRQLYPDWEIRYLAVPRGTDREERRRYERAWQALTGKN